MFIKRNGGCFRYGRCHSSKSCPYKSSTIPGFPCNLEHKHDTSKNFHNSGLHVPRYQFLRDKFLTKVDLSKSNTNIIESDEFYDYQLEEIDDDLICDYTGCTISNNDIECWSDMNQCLTYIDDPDCLQHADSHVGMVHYSVCEINALNIIQPRNNNYRTFVRVILGNPEGTFQVTTIALLDTGSDCTFIDKTIQDKAHIKGKGSFLKLNGFNNSQNRPVTICNCVIVNPETEKGFCLTNVASLDLKKGSLVPSDTIPSRRIVNSTPGLEKIILAKESIMPYAHRS